MTRRPSGAKLSPHFAVFRICPRLNRKGLRDGADPLEVLARETITTTSPDGLTLCPKCGKRLQCKYNLRRHVSTSVPPLTFISLFDLERFGSSTKVPVPYLLGNSFPLAVLRIRSRPD